MSCLVRPGAAVTGRGGVRRGRGGQDQSGGQGERAGAYETGHDFLSAATTGRESPLLSSTAFLSGRPGQVLRLAPLTGAYGCGSAPDFDRLPPTTGVDGRPAGAERPHPMQHSALTCPVLDDFACAVAGVTPYAAAARTPCRDRRRPECRDPADPRQREALRKRARPRSGGGRLRVVVVRVGGFRSRGVFRGGLFVRPGAEGRFVGSAPFVARRALGVPPGATVASAVVGPRAGVLRTRPGSDGPAPGAVRLRRTRMGAGPAVGPGCGDGVGVGVCASLHPARGDVGGVAAVVVPATPTPPSRPRAPSGCTRPVGSRPTRPCRRTRTAPSSCRRAACRRSWRWPAARPPGTRRRGTAAPAPGGARCPRRVARRCPCRRRERSRWPSSPEPVVLDDHLDPPPVHAGSGLCRGGTVE